MRSLVVYDSVYDNTREVAEAVREGLGKDADVVQASAATPERVAGVGLLVVGSPTHGGRPTEPVQAFISSLLKAASGDIRAAAFDTRYSGRFVRVFGFAADRIAQSLEAKGVALLARPEAFFVSGKKGPLKDGERERAVRWGKALGELAERSVGNPQEQ